MSWFSNFCLFCPYGKSFLSYRPFWEKGTKWPIKWPSILQGQMYPIYVLLVSKSPEFHSVSLYGHTFLIHRPFWDKCTEWPQNDLEPNKVKSSTRSICIQCPLASNFSPFHFTASCFWVTGHFETNSLNDPKMTLKTTIFIIGTPLMYY